MPLLELKTSQQMTNATIAIIAATEEQLTRAAALAERLRLPLAPATTADYDFLLVVTGSRLELHATGRQAPGPLYVDFVKGSAGYRRLHGGGRKQLIARAVGIRKEGGPLVLDATAGLGRDAFALACLGCRVLLYERSPVIAALLADGLERAQRCEEIAAVVKDRMKLVTGDSSLLTAFSLGGEQPDVVYLDPMYPHRDKSALVKKEMRLLRALVGSDEDAPLLLARGLLLARKRVVVKRPRQAPSLAGPAPTLVLTGRSSRYDIYLITVRSG